MPRPKTWQPGLTDEEKQLARKIGATFEVEVSENAVAKQAIKRWAKELGVEA